MEHVTNLRKISHPPNTDSTVVNDPDIQIDQHAATKGTNVNGTAKKGKYKDRPNMFRFVRRFNQ
jgi:hypothetical protein